MKGSYKIFFMFPFTLNNEIKIKYITYYNQYICVWCILNV